MKSAVSIPFSDTAMIAKSADDLKRIADKVVGYMCEGMFTLKSIEETAQLPVQLELCSKYIFIPNLQF